MGRVITDTSDWGMYVNTANGYQLKFPKNARISARAEDEDALPLDKLNRAHIFVPGESTEVYVEAYAPRAASAKTLDLASTLNQSAVLPLQEFAEDIRQMQVRDKSPYAAGKMIGELQDSLFAGQNAYSFTLTKTFTESSDGSYGYALPDGATYNYVLLENRSGTKLMIHYPLGDYTSESIAASFQLL